MQDNMTKLSERLKAYDDDGSSSLHNLLTLFLILETEYYLSTTFKGAIK